VIYRGSANVRRVSESNGNLVIGVEVRAPGIDLAELYRLGTRQSFQVRLEALLDGVADDVPQEFKAWVADLRSYLERASEFLDQEERMLDDMDSYTRQQALDAYLEAGAQRIVERMNRASLELPELVRGLNEEQHSASRVYYKSQLLPLFEKSPLLRRASAKPLGYAGDYEMMNMLYRDHAEGSSLFGRALNLYAAQESAARSVVNRLDYLSSKIRRAIEVRGRVRLASIGCGPARELFKVLDEYPELGPFLDVALIDQEERVITYCERTLGPLVNRTGARIHFIRESVRRLLTTRKLRDALGERDLIYSAGLFDYLDDRSFSALLSVLYEALAPTGQLVIGNYAIGNPSRYFMEYCLDWFLIHRDDAEMRQFASKLEPSPTRVEVEAEALGVNLFLNVWKQ
jgi:extracellular factor (EF) 3-hydroxypalmitic acid methyl ester biosynthesis protein